MKRDEILDALFGDEWDSVEALHDRAREEVVVQLRISDPRFHAMHDRLHELAANERAAVVAINRKRPGGVPHRPGRRRVRHRHNPLLAKLASLAFEPTFVVDDRIVFDQDYP